MSGSPMQGPRSVPPRDRLVNRTNDHVPVTQDGAGTNANFPRESLDERAADAVDRGRSRTTDDPELDATDLEDTQPEDKAPAAPRSVVVRGGSAGSGTAVEDELKRLVELTEGGDIPKLHELGFGGTAPFAGSRRWHNEVLEKSDWERPQSKSWTESLQWTEGTIMCMNNLGLSFDIGITSQEPQTRLTGKRYDHPNRVDQRMYGLLYVESKELAQIVEKYLQNWARINDLRGFKNDPDAAGSGQLNEGPHTIYLVFWMTEEGPAERQYATPPALTESEAEDSADDYVPNDYHQKRCRSRMTRGEESSEDEAEPELDPAPAPSPREAEPAELSQPVTKKLRAAERTSSPEPMDPEVPAPVPRCAPDQRIAILRAMMMIRLNRDLELFGYPL